MTIFKATAAVCCMALVSAVAVQNAKADEWNQKTFVTFAGPIETPVVPLAGWSVLPPGTYVFKLLDSQADRHIVEIFNKDQTVLYATILAVPNDRLKATGKTVITFSERPAGQPDALRAWFHPGSTAGEEFVYPKTRALELAKTSNMPVLFTAVDISAEAAKPIESVADPAAVTMKKAPVLALQPSGEEIQISGMAVLAPPAILPSTASTAPVFRLLGLMALAGALLTGASARRIQYSKN